MHTSLHGVQVSLKQNPHQRAVRADLYDVDGDGTLHGHAAQVHVICFCCRSDGRRRAGQGVQHLREEAGETEHE